MYISNGCLTVFLHKKTSMNAKFRTAVALTFVSTRQAVSTAHAPKDPLSLRTTSWNALVSRIYGTLFELFMEYQTDTKYIIHLIFLKCVQVSNWVTQICAQFKLVCGWNNPHLLEYLIRICQGLFDFYFYLNRELKGDPFIVGLCCNKNGKL